MLSFASVYHDEEIWTGDAYFAMNSFSSPPKLLVNANQVLARLSGDKVPHSVTSDRAPSILARARSRLRGGARGRTSTLIRHTYTPFLRSPRTHRERCIAVYMYSIHPNDACGSQKLAGCSRRVSLTQKGIATHRRKGGLVSTYPSRCVSALHSEQTSVCTNTPFGGGDVSSTSLN
jgi:hypothetical protein